MVFSKEQLKNYWQSHKEELNRKRRERRRLAKLGLATLKEVSQVEPLNEVEPLKVSHNEVEPTANPKQKTANLETANPVEVSHGKPIKLQPCPHCPELETKIKEMTTQLKAVYYTYPIILEEEKPENVKKYIGELHNRLEELETDLSVVKAFNKDLQKPINPTIEHWKAEYFKLEKETNTKLKDQSDTILRLKEKLRSKSTDHSTSHQASPNIPLQAEFIPLFYDKKNKKYISYSCADSCWTGKSCSNCLEYSTSSPRSH